MNMLISILIQIILAVAWYSVGRSRTQIMFAKKLKALINAVSIGDIDKKDIDKMTDAERTKAMKTVAWQRGKLEAFGEVFESFK